MSCYGWEHGTITLPSAEVAGLKKILRDYVKTLHDEVRAEAIRLHKEVAKSTRSARLYRERLTAYDEQRWEAERRRSTGWHSTSLRTDEHKALVSAMARSVLHGMLNGQWGQPAPTPHQPTVADVNSVIAKATNRTVHFPIIGPDGYDEGSITFDGRQVIWDVPENNHSVDRAHESEIARKFFQALDKVKWTRGTGGSTYGNNEYNEGEHGHGRGPDYLVSTWGPRGDDEQVFRYVSSGFTRKAAKEMVEAAKRPQRQVYPAYGSAYGRW